MPTVRLPPSLLSRRDELTRRASAITDDGVLDFKKRAQPESDVVVHRLRPACSINRHMRRWGGGVMRPFCPDGYVLVQEAVAGAALYWSLEEISALMNAAEAELAINNKPNDDTAALTSVQRLARALAPAPSISEGLRQQ